MFQAFHEIWAALGDLKPGQAVLVTGFVGAVTLMIGHATNAYLTSRRDRKIELIQRLRVETAFVAEFTLLSAQLQHIEKRLSRMKDGIDASDRILIPKCRLHTPLREEVFKHMLHFNQRQIKTVVNLYGACEKFDNLMRHNHGHKNSLVEADSMMLVDVAAGETENLHHQFSAMVEKIDRDIDRFRLERWFHIDRWHRWPIYGFREIWRRAYRYGQGRDKATAP